MEDTNCWSWNDSYHIGEFTTKGNEKRAFLNALHKLGIILKQGSCYIDYDGSIYEIRQKKDDCPILAAIPIE